MPWHVEYFQEADGRIPGVEFEDSLERSSNSDERALLGLLDRWTRYAADQGPLGDGGGHFEKCRTVPVWQIKASRGGRRARHFFGWDDALDRLVLLSGIVKGARTRTPPEAYATAQAEWRRYQQTRRVAKEDE